jgi:regulatory protein
MPGEAERQRPARSLKARAVALLARREYSRAELRAKLAGGGAANAADSEDIDRVLDELAALGYLSDARFARTLVRQKSGGYSKRSIGATLKARGVGGETAADAIDGGDIDDEAAMIALWRRRFGKAPADDREKARQVRFLQSRGFSLSAIFKLLRNPPGDEGGGEEIGNR